MLIAAALSCKHFVKRAVKLLQLTRKAVTTVLAMQRNFGSCNADFMFATGAPAGGYCAATCNRCPSAFSPSPVSTPAPSSCDDVSPDSQYTCQQQQAMGKCNAAYMLSPDAPVGGYCAATCGRCDLL